VSTSLAAAMRCISPTIGGAIWSATAGAKTAFLRHLYIKTNILPRQARDKHRENSKKMPFFAGLDYPLHPHLTYVCICCLALVNLRKAWQLPLAINQPIVGVDWLKTGPR
jgi:hypothetical protein